MRVLSLVLPVCLLASGCTSEEESPPTVLSGAAVTDGAAVAPDVTPAIVEQSPLKKGKAFEDGMGFAYNGSVTLSGEYVLENHDGAESLCFGPDAESAKKLPDTESNGAFCFSNEAEARKLLKVKPVAWDKLPKNMCQAMAAATVTVTDYEDWVSDGDGMDQARLKSVQATSSEAKLFKCDWIPVDEEKDVESASSGSATSSSVDGASGKWPAKTGVYIASSSASIPQFPERTDGYKAAATTSGKIRVFEGNGWTGLPDVGAGMNSCGDSMWMVRWRSANSVTVITANAGLRVEDAGDGNEGSTHGYMFGYRCEQPAFKFGHSGNATNLVDVYYELMEWNAAP